ncbi:MAG: c-type cytochrome domain-containing protein [Acidobacteriota bacterium]
MRKLVVCISISLWFLFLLQATQKSGSEEPQAGPAEAVAEVFAKNCYSCHNEVDKEGGLSMQTHDALMLGGKNGPAVIPGDSEKSRLLQMVLGFLEPIMPEDGFLFDEDIEIIRRWIEAGAPAWTGDLARLSIADVPDIEPKVPVKAEIASLAFGPDGKLVAAGTFHEVHLIDWHTGEVRKRLGGHVETVRAVAFSPDGALLAAAGGIPSRYGEIKIWDLETGSLLQTLEGHNDCIYSAVFSPDSSLLATCSYDRLIKIWDVKSGKEVRTIKGHVDAVYSIAFGPEGKRLFSASADRTVKVWSVDTGEQLFRPLSESTAELYTLALHPTGNLIAAAGADKMIRIWRITGQGGQLARSAFAHDSPILRLTFTPDGKTLISSGADHLVKFWDVETLLEKKVLDKQPDWVLALAVSPNGQVLALGRYDGSVEFHGVRHDENP